MSLWDYLEARAERRDAREFLLIERGLDARSMLKGLVGAIEPKFIIAATIIGLFAWAFAGTKDRDTANLMVGALIAAFAGAWGYYLGSSSTASVAHDRADKALDLGREAVKALPKKEAPDVEVAPGERVVVEGEERR